MSTKLTIITTCGLLAIASCGKGDLGTDPQTENTEVKTIRVDGQNYNIDGLIKGLASVLKVSNDQIYFDSTESVFRSKLFSNHYTPELVVQLTESLPQR